VNRQLEGRNRAYTWNDARPAVAPDPHCTTWRASAAACRGGFCRGFWVLTRGSRPRATTYSITPASASRQFRYSAPSPGSDRGGLAGGLGASVGRPMADSTMRLLWRRRVLPPGPEGLHPGCYVRVRRFDSRIRVGPPTGRPGCQPSLCLAFGPEDAARTQSPLSCRFPRP
jgi:hypothetical protein